MRIPILLLLFLVATALGCKHNSPSPEWNSAIAQISAWEYAFTNSMKWPSVASDLEVVIVSGATIKATTKNGTISISAHDGYSRAYTWDEQTRNVTLWPRKIRWHGKYGLYFPGPGEHWKNNNGITRGVLEEAAVWFSNEEDAVKWINEFFSKEHSVYNDEGLFVSWGKNVARKQINVDVFQIMINGKKPSKLPGSSNENISLEKTRNY
jgi:hypothetical protein